MNRRHFLAFGGWGAVCVLSGCIDTIATGDDGESLEVNADKPELAPGEETTIFVEARNINGFTFQGETGNNTGFRHWDDGKAVEFGITDITFSPTWDDREESDPPTWIWSPATSVEIAIPVNVNNDAESGEYRHGVVAWQGEPEDREYLKPDLLVTVSDE